MTIDLNSSIERLRDSNPYCSQCGKTMKPRMGGYRQDILFWECSTILKVGPHDDICIGYIKFTPKYDTKTGERL